MGEELDELQRSLDLCYSEIMHISDASVRLDLKRMHSAAQGMVSECSRELVTCRRLKSYTSGYRLKIQELKDAVTNLEHYLTMGHLIKDQSGERS